MKSAHAPVTHRFTLWVTNAAIAAATFCPSPSQACGGLFCSASNPVNQAAERIVFSQNDDDTITAVIEIQYEGPSERFAWVLPLPAGELEVGVSSKLALDRLQQQSNPQYNLQLVSNCGAMNGNLSAPGAASTTTGGAVAADGAQVPRVVVLQEGSAGPYDYQLIQVDDTFDDPADAAIEWLEENDYDVSALGPDLLRPYLQDEMNLLAFRLSKGNDSGSIRPVMITYEGDTPSIPIRPTAVAAEDDMGVMVWVLGDARAVPANYLHLELNEALIDWFNPNRTYNDVVTAAADDAGGQGFVTEQAGPASSFAEATFASWEEAQFSALRTGSFASVEQFLQQALNSFGSYDGMRDVMKDPEVVPLREGATAEQLMSCVTCYFQQNVPVRNDAYPSTDFDPETDPLLDMDVLGFLSKMDEVVVGPMRKTRDLFEENSTVTRFYTTMSADEMTDDPLFEFNPELPDYDNVHTAQQLVECSDTNQWRVVLDQGAVVQGTARTWPVELADTEMPVNLRIMQLGTRGDGMVVEDNADAIVAALDDMDVGGAPSNADMDVVISANQVNDRGDGGGCSVGGPSNRPGSGAVLTLSLLLGSLFLGRQRRRFVL